MISMLEAFYNAGWFYILMLLLIFGVVVAVVMLIRKYAKPFQSDEKPKTPKEIADEEVSRMVRPVEDEATRKQMEEAARRLEEESRNKAPTKAEVTSQEVARATRPVEDAKAVAAMAAYAESHPDEAEAALKNDETAKTPDKADEK